MLLQPNELINISHVIGLLAVAVWTSCNGVDHISKVILRWARLVVRWVSVRQWCNQPSRPIQSPPLSGMGNDKWVPANRQWPCSAKSSITVCLYYACVDSGTSSASILKSGHAKPVVVLFRCCTTRSWFVLCSIKMHVYNNRSGERHCETRWRAAENSSKVSCVKSLWPVTFSSTKPRDWLGRTSPKWPILCREGRKTLTQSITGGYKLPFATREHWLLHIEHWPSWRTVFTACVDRCPWTEHPRWWAVYAHETLKPEIETRPRRDVQNFETEMFVGHETSPRR